MSYCQAFNKKYNINCDKVLGHKGPHAERLSEFKTSGKQKPKRIERKHRHIYDRLPILIYRDGRISNVCKCGKQKS